jgi:hypothetical protein
MSVPFTIIQRLPTPRGGCPVDRCGGLPSPTARGNRDRFQPLFFSVCAEPEGETIGFGRVIGAGGLPFYLTHAVVNPAIQLAAWAPRS